MVTEYNYSEENKLDKDFAQILRPFHVIQSFYSANKFQLNLNSIRPNSYRHAITTITMNLLVLLWYYFTLKLTNFDVYIFNVSMYAIAYSHFCIAYFIMSLSNFVRRKQWVDMIVTLQKVRRALRAKCSKSDRNYSVINWCFCFFPIVVIGTMATVKLTLDPTWNWARALLMCSSSIFDMDMFQTTFVLMFLSDHISAWKDIISTNETTANIGIDNNHEGNNNVSDSLVETFETILRASKLNILNFRLTVLTYVVKTFLQSVMYVAILIQWVKLRQANDKEQALAYFNHLGGVISWVLKGLIVETTFCVVSERLDGRIDEVKAACANLINSNVDVSLRRTAKNVIRLCGTRYSKFRVCGVFVVDAALPLRLIGLVATYCIVLLQFAFL